MCNEAARLRSLGEISAEFNDLKIPLRFPEGLPNLAAGSFRITDATVIVRAARGGGDDSPTGPSGRRDGSVVAEMVMRRWSWPGAAGKPVYNFRSEGRRFDERPDAPVRATGGRCLIPIDVFFEFTDAGAMAEAERGSALALALPGQSAAPALRVEEAVAPVPRPDGRGAKGRKDKWAFTAADGGLLGVAGLWRAGVVPLPAGTAGTAADAAEPGRATEAFTMLTCAPGPDIAQYHGRQIVLLPRARWADWLGGVVPAAELIAPTPAGTLRVAPAR